MLGSYIEQQSKSIWLLHRGKNQYTKEGKEQSVSQLLGTCPITA